MNLGVVCWTIGLTSTQLAQEQEAMLKNFNER